MALIEVENLYKSYFTDEVETEVLQDMNFEIDSGEFVTIMGPSGSGKSTLLNILGFLDKPTEGEYRFEGKTINEYKEDRVARVRNAKMGFIFQEFNLLSKATVLENVKLPLVYSDVPEENWEARAKEVLGQVGLSHRLDYTPNQLSGGQKQRVAIARALVNDPEVIFADEPTGNLDTETGDVVMEEIDSLHKNFDHTVVVITHENRTANYADRLLQIKDGRVVRDATNFDLEHEF